MATAGPPPPSPLPLREVDTPNPIPPHPKFLVDPSISEAFPAPASPGLPPPFVAAVQAPPPEPALNTPPGEGAPLPLFP